MRGIFIRWGIDSAARKDTPMRWQSGVTPRSLTVTDTSSALSPRTLLARLAAAPALTAGPAPGAARTSAAKTTTGSPRRTFLHLAAGAAALPAISRIARAQTYPVRPVRIIFGFAAGSTGDMIARLMGQWLSEHLGQPFTIENRTGDSGNIATEAVVHAAPDGYTLLLVTAANAINATLYEKLSFNFMRDIVPVAGINRMPLVMEVNPSVPAKTVPEFIAYAKANPGKINMASAGNGSGIHMAGELFMSMAGISMVHVPYRGAPPALTDLLGGRCT
jgi:tripartite-type tricarboxylate transporter receptor subunit TctC